MSRHLYLRKASDALVSHCRCAPEEALIAYPGQADCPWCGCGWLFACIVCRKGFTFAEAVEIDEPRESLASRDLRGLSGREPKPRDVTEWLEGMQILLEEIRSGEQYVYFDGSVFATSEPGVDLMGWHSRHRLDFIPQVAALQDPEIRTRLLASPDYWHSTALGTSEFS